MPFAASFDGCRLFYRVEGPIDAPALIMSNSLGTDHLMWQPQADALNQHFRVIRYDQRGHGASDAFHNKYTLSELGRDVLAIADKLGLETFLFCGLSMGGLTGQWLGVNAPERVSKMALADTSAQFPPVEMWDERIKMVGEKGMAPLSSLTLERFFTKRFHQAQPATIEAYRHVFENTEPAGYIGCCEALKMADMREELKKITAPTLVISGEHDPSTPPERGEFICGEIAGAEHLVLDAAHISNVEQPAAFSQALIDHFS